MEIYDKHLQRTVSFDKTHFSDLLLWDIFVDREENMWLATENGVYRYGNLTIRNYALENSHAVPQVRNGAGIGNTFLFTNRITVNSLNNGKLNSVSILENNVHPLN